MASASLSVSDPDDQSRWADQKRRKGKSVKLRMLEQCKAENGSKRGKRAQWALYCGANQKNKTRMKNNEMTVIYYKTP